MATAKNTNKKIVKKSNLKTYGTAAGIIFALYIIGIINPITGNYLKYPYYELFCGKKPVVASSFMGSKTYKTSDMLNYRITNMSSTLYCTESDARSNGYQKY